ncbi:MAG: DciA family protein, partial [Betaproteobacteria bacterium]
MPADTAHSFLIAAPNLQPLLQEANKLLSLQNAWSEITPSPLAKASRVRTVRGQTLVVSASNGAIAAKLRQLAPSLLAKIRERGVEVTAIRVDVQVEAPPPSRKPKDLALSRSALASLANLEQNLAASPLKDAL